MFALLAKWLAAPAKLELYPGWRLSIGKSEPGVLFRLRRHLWRHLPEKCIIRWLAGLYLYLYPGNEISRAIFLTGHYEPNEFYWLAHTLRPGMRFVDIGANFGLYTLFAARKVGATGMALAIEPSSQDFKKLKANVELNRLANVRLLQLAVSDYFGQAELLIAQENKSGHNTLGAFGYNSIKQQGTEAVEVQPLDALLATQELGRIDVVKIDVEGAEVHVLRSARKMFERYLPAVLLEVSDRTLNNQDCHSGQIWDFFNDLGYELYEFSKITGLLEKAQQKPAYNSENLIALHLHAISGKYSKVSCK